MAHQPRVIGILASSYARLDREVSEILRDVPSDRVMSISYAVSRVFGVLWLQHHVLIVLRHD